MTQEIATFDYETIDPETRNALQKTAGEIRGLYRRAASDVVQIGLKLIEAKEQLKKEGKQFLPWLAAEFGEWSDRTAHNFIEVAKAFSFANFANMTFATSALYLLAAPSTVQAARDEALERAGEGEEITHAKAKEIVERHKGGPTPLPVVERKLAGYVTLTRWQEASPAEREAWLAAEGGEAKFNSQGGNENIEWALWSWNPVTGCLHDCPYCYARDIANRFYEQKFAPSLWPERLAAPANTPFPAAKAAEWMGHKNVFTCSMADLFGRWVPREWIDAVIDAVKAAPQWNFLFLTKFPQRMSEFVFPANAWVGTSVDCQARVKNAEKAFRKVKAGVKWLSCEPLIEPLAFTDLGAFDWVVLGGASASSQTPEWHPPREWVNAIEAEAERAGVKVYEKTNLLARIREYPGIDGKPVTEAPEVMRYLPNPEDGK